MMSHCMLRGNTSLTTPPAACKTHWVFTFTPLINFTSNMEKENYMMLSGMITEKKSTPLTAASTTPESPWRNYLSYMEIENYLYEVGMKKSFTA